jgi:ubiquinone biosynthesis protein
MFNIPRRFAGIKRFEQILQVMAKYELGYYLEKASLKKKSLFSKRGMTRPVELRMMFEELGGSFIKLGQLLSLRPDLIPKEYCDELSNLQDDCEPFPYEEVEHVIKAELKKPVKQLFKSFEKKPLASASIGQVHVARLKSGKKVAVKVMRPGISALIASDLEILDYISRLFKHHIRQSIVNPEDIFAEFKRYTEDELDYVKEAHNIKLFYRNFKNDKTVKIPLVYEKLSTKKVLVMEFIEGTAIREMLHHPKQHVRLDKSKISQLIVNSVMKQIFIDGFFHADPHPGNIIIGKVSGSGKKKGKGRGKENNKGVTIGLIDFGIVGRVDQDMKEKVGMLFISLMHGDIDGIVKSIICLNLVDDCVDANRLKNDINESLGQYYNTSVDKLDITDLFFKSINVAKKHNIKFPRDFVLLGKALVTLQGLGIELNPGFNIVHESQTFIGKLVKDKAKPTYIFNKLLKEAERFGDFVHELPDESRRIYKTIAKADVALDDINTDIRGLTAEIRTESWRIILGMIIAALVIGASLTIQIEPFISKSLIALASIMLLYLIYAIIRDDFRNRHS